MNILQATIVFIGSALVATCAVWLSIVGARRWKFFDYPDMARKVQTQPIPTLGGVAVALSLLLSTCLALWIADRAADIPAALGVLTPALGVALIGFVDDRRNLDPKLRLVLQACMASVAWFTGTQLVVTGISLVDFAIFVLWVMTIVNGMNLLDNSDGLAGSTALIAALGAGVIAVLGSQQIVGMMGFALGGVALGFLWHNWYPARVYLGDSGAYFLGFMLSILVVRLRPENLPAWLGIVVAVLLLFLPILDLSYVVVKRMSAGVHPFTAGRDHLSHRLQDLGASVPGSVLKLQLISLLTTCAAVTIVLLH